MPHSDSEPGLKSAAVRSTGGGVSAGDSTERAVTAVVELRWPFATRTAHSGRGAEGRGGAGAEVGSKRSAADGTAHRNTRNR
jgi:hypothetical protein